MYHSLKALLTECEIYTGKYLPEVFVPEVLLLFKLFQQTLPTVILFYFHLPYFPGDNAHGA